MLHLKFRTFLTFYRTSQTNHKLFFIDILFLFCSNGALLHNKVRCYNNISRTVILLRHMRSVQDMNNRLKIRSRIWLAYNAGKPDVNIFGVLYVLFHVYVKKERLKKDSPEWPASRKYSS